jgi:C1A family cysteine protease
MLLLKKLLFILFFITTTTLLYSQQKYSSGLIFDKEEYDKVEKISSALKFNDVIKEIYSLKQFCPTPGNQGRLGTCTSWATGYAALTISYSIDNNINDIKEIDNNSFSPLYIYNQIKANNSCEGAQLLKAIKLAQIKGDCKFTDFNPVDCNYLPGYLEDNKAQLYKIKDNQRLFDDDTSEDSKISSVINSLALNKPVVIGLKLRKSIYKISKNGNYIPTDNEGFAKNEDGSISCHALCIIGYDNKKSQFEVINSWGVGWGNNGFFYLKYDDFLKDCFEAYNFTLNQNNNRIIKLKGNFQILKFIENDKTSNKNKFEIITPFLGSDQCYYIEKSIKRNDYFRLKATNLVKNTYVYIISYKPDTTAEVLFPVNYKKNNQDSPLILSNNSFIDLPENLENAYSTDQKGDDVLCILYSNKRIDDLDKKILTIKTFNGNIWDWLKNSFKNEIVDESYYKYNTFDMGINSNERFIGNIIPLILKVKVE